MPPVICKATITEISDATEVELRRGRDDDVLEMIMANPKVNSQRYKSGDLTHGDLTYLDLSALLSSEATGLRRCDDGRRRYAS